MTNLHITTVKPPFNDHNLAAMANTALSRADAMGLLSERVTCLDDNAIVKLENGIANAGIGLGLPSPKSGVFRPDPDNLSALLERIIEALDASPAPEHEWRALHSTLGLELLSRLLGVSSASIRRYVSGSRTTPDRIAACLHSLAFVVGDLAGAYNDIGIRRWFDRPRARLNGNTPAQELGENWVPEDEGPRRVRELAHTLVMPTAT